MCWNSWMNVDGRFSPERGRVGRVQERVEHRAERIEVEGRERTPVRLVRAVLEHRDMRSHVAGKGNDLRVRRAVGIATNLEDASVTHHGWRLKERWRRWRAVAHAHAAGQVPLRPPQWQIELLLSRDRRCTPYRGG